MPDSLFAQAIAAAADTARGAPPQSQLQGEISGLEGVPHDIGQIPLLQHMSAVIPAADLIFGGVMLILIILIHAAGVRAATNHVLRRSRTILARPTFWRADLLMGSTVFILLVLHLAELLVWAAALVYSGLVSDWRAAGFFAGNTYTTIGYGNDILPVGWRMLAPIIAISGLFTFGWSGSVLVDLVGRCQKIKDAAGVSRGRREVSRARG